MYIQLESGLEHGYTTCFMVYPEKDAPKEQRLALTTSRIWNVSRLPIEESDAIFGPLNEYLATLTKEQNDLIFSRYIDIYNVLMKGYGDDEVDKVLSKAIPDIIAQLDYDDLSKWVRTSSGMSIPSELTDETPPGYSPKITYLREEYIDLVTLHFYFKILAPFWPTYLGRWSNAESQFRDEGVLRYYEKTVLHSLPPVERLKVYIDEQIRLVSGRMMPMLLRYMSTEQAGEYYLAFVLTRTLSILNIRKDDKMLITNLYYAMFRLNQNATNGVRPKNVNGGGDGPEDDSIANSVRVRQKIGDHDLVPTEVRLEQPRRLIEDLLTMPVEEVRRRSTLTDYEKIKETPTASPEEVDRLMGEYEKRLGLILDNPKFVVHEYHYIIAGIILDDLIIIRVLPLMESRRALLNAIAIASTWLFENGYADLSMMILAPTKEKTHLEPSFNHLDVLHPLTKANKDNLRDLYPYVHVNTQGQQTSCPGTEMLERMKQKVSDLEWESSNVVPVSLLNDVVEVLVIFNQ